MTDCPAATGIAQCRPPDTAHRCTRRASHAFDGDGSAVERVVHHCSCGHRWTCLTGSINELFAILDSAGGA